MIAADQCSPPTDADPVDPGRLMLVYQHDGENPGWRMFTLAGWLKVINTSRWTTYTGPRKDCS